MAKITALPLLLLVAACGPRAAPVLPAADPPPSSGYFGYDADLINSIATWRYRPFLVDGAAQPVCAVIQSIYRQRS